MKNLFKILFVALLAMGIAACSKEEGGVPVENAGKTYMSFTIQLPTTRSATDEEGTTNSDAAEDFENGQDYENTIANVQLVMLKGDDVIAVSLDKPVPPRNGDYCVVFNSADLQAAAVDNATTEVHVIAFINHKGGLVKGKKLADVFEEKVTDAPGGAMWQNGKFWMTNANDVDWIIQLPSKTDLVQYSTADNPCDLGKIKVERTAARFDYAAQATQHFTVEAEKVSETETKPLFGVTLTELAMFNISEECYKLRRVSDDGTNANGAWDLFGKETPANYVVDTDYAAKTDLNTTLQWTKISDMTTADLWVESADPKVEPDYYIWRYGVENTIPQGNGDEQKEKYATGVVFKGEITAEADAPQGIKDVLEAGEDPIYVYNHKTLYGTWNQVLAAAAQDEMLKAAVDQVLQTYGEGQIEPDSENWKTALAGASFLQYKPNAETKKYEIYYNYYNRHNDNGDSQVSCNMEFAVVRNNVYKLKVSGITAYGTPEPKEPGDDPIEESVTYFKVCVQVLPWVVRLNDIVLDPALY